VIVCAAAASGLMIGGFSVLGVALAVIEPPAHDAPAGSAVFDGRAHIVQQAPAALPTTLQAAAAPAGSAVVSNGAASPPALQHTPAQVLDETWPDAPSARARRAPQSTAAPQAPNGPTSSDVASNRRLHTITTRHGSNEDNKVAANRSPAIRQLE
jgi:hypothetical protein